MDVIICTESTALDPFKTLFINHGIKSLKYWSQGFLWIILLGVVYAFVAVRILMIWLCILYFYNSAYASVCLDQMSIALPIHVIIFRPLNF